MKYHHISGRISTDTLVSLYKFLNHTEGKITITLSSHGGSLSIGQAVVDALNARADDCILYVIDHAHSTAMDIFLSFRGPKKVGLGGFGIFHQTTIGELVIFENGKLSLDSLAKVRLMRHVKKYMRTKAEAVLTPAEFLRYQDGEDIYIDYPRMKRLCKIYV